MENSISSEVPLQMSWPTSRFELANCIFQQLEGKPEDSITESLELWKNKYAEKILQTIRRLEAIQRADRRQIK